MHSLVSWYATLAIADVLKCLCNFNVITAHLNIGTGEALSRSFLHISTDIARSSGKLLSLQM